MKAGLYEQYVTGLEQLGIKPISDDTAARILAIIYVYGGDHEDFVFNGSLKTDLDYAARRANIGGGLIPDRSMSSKILGYISEIQSYERRHPYVGSAWCGRSYPDWVKKLMSDKYDIRL